MKKSTIRANEVPSARFKQIIINNSSKSLNSGGTDDFEEQIKMERNRLNMAQEILRQKSRMGLINKDDEKQQMMQMIRAVSLNRRHSKMIDEKKHKDIQ